MYVEPTATQCPLCQGDAISVRWAGSGDWAGDSQQAFLCTTTSRVRPEILRCAGCSHEFSNPASWPEDLSHEYDILEDTEYLGMVDIKRRTFTRAADLLGRYAKAPARVLEIGAYAGLFLEICRDRGYDVVGVEPSAWGAALAVANGHAVHHGTAEQHLANDSLGTFDAVVSWDVLEHVADPIRFMNLAAQRVRPGGILIVSTLDRTNWFARLMGKRWPWLIPMHLHYFDQKSVIDMARANGMVMLKTKAHVHYTSAGYAAKRLLGHGDSVSSSKSLLDKAIFPVGFGDVRLYVFQKSEIPGSR